MQPVKSAGPLKIIKIYRKLQISIEIWINEMKKKGWGGGKRRCVKCLAMAVLH
jgi:phenylpyruvate tautomerase PptA (4-oxalocrotonate tautomerase family)